MGRAEHNLKRRLKLFQKHTGQAFNPWSHQITGRWSSWDSSQGSSNWYGSWNDTSYKDQQAVDRKLQQHAAKLVWKEQESSSYVKQGTKKLKQTSAGAKAAKSTEKRKLSKKGLSKADTPKTKRRSRLSSADDDSGAERPKRKVKLRKKTLTGSAAVTAEQAADEPKRKKKLRKRKGSEGEGAAPQAAPRKLKKRKKSSTPKEEGILGTKPLLKGRKLKAMMRRKAKAYIICPGSISDRFGKQPKNDNERQLLWSGQLSWQWLRETDNPSGAKVVEEDEFSHQKAMKWQEYQLHWKAFGRVKDLDHALGRYALWPSCSERVQLAVGLHARGALRKRCTQHAEKCLAPLLMPDASASRGSAEIVAAARERLRRCAAKKQEDAFPAESRQASVDSAAAKRIWLRLLIEAANSTFQTKDKLGWMTALQVAFFSRFCPALDAAAFKDQCRAIAQSLAADQQPSASNELCLLPLGVFTACEVLLLLVATCALGEPATVIRRSAEGVPDVIFRTSEVTAGAS